MDHSGGVLTVSLCLICHNRPRELGEAIASAAGEPWSETVIVDMASVPPLNPDAAGRWIRSDENLGVAGGRNRLADEARSDILVFLDDDAVFIAPQIARATELFAADPRLAVVAFRVQRAGGEVLSREVPFRGSSPDADTPRDAAYFLGGAHAIRRSAMRDVGGYDDRFFYDGEETDLSFALLGAGWRIRYEPSIVVEHRPARKGRVRAPEVAALTWRNRLLIARRHLPWPIAAIHVTAWGLKSGLLAMRSGDVRPWLRATRQGFRMPVERAPVAWRVLQRAHRLGGRVLW